MLLLTSSRVAKDVSASQKSECNLTKQIANHDAIAGALRKRINQSEAQLGECLEVLRSPERIYAALVSKIGDSQALLAEIQTQNSLLEHQHGHDRREVDAGRRQVALVRLALDERDRTIKEVP